MTHAQRKSVPATNSAGRLRVCIVAPFPPPFGGMSIQAQKLAVLLRGEGLEVSTVDAVEDWRALRNIPVVRTLTRELRYLIRLLVNTRRSSVVHHFAASDTYFFLVSAPALLLTHCLRRKMVLNYHGGKADGFLQKWGFFAAPLLRLADVTVVPSNFLVTVFERHGLPGGNPAEHRGRAAIPVSPANKVRPAPAGHPAS